MTLNEKRIAVALVCGWKWFPAYNKRKKMNFLVPPSGRAVTVWKDGELGGGDALPNYPNDLNAMHEAASFLRNKDRMVYLDYAKNLDQLMARYNSLPEREAYRSLATVDAPASMRVEAFLMAVEAWKP